MIPQYDKIKTKGRGHKSKEAKGSTKCIPSKWEQVEAKIASQRGNNSTLPYEVFFKLPTRQSKRKSLIDSQRARNKKRKGFYNLLAAHHQEFSPQIGRASCRERV